MWPPRAFPCWSGAAVPAIAFLLSTVSGSAASLASQAIDTTSYYFSGHAVPLFVHLDSLGLYAPGAAPAAIDAVVPVIGGAGVRALGKGLYIVGFPVPLSRPDIVNRARQAVQLAPGTIRAGGLAVRTDGAVDPAIVTDEFIVKFQPSVTLEQIHTLNAANGVQIVDSLNVIGDDYLLTATAASVLDAVDLANLYHEHPAVVFASPNFYDIKREQSVAPNDELFGDQWYLSSTNDADIDAPEAWNITKGSPSIVIAILEPWGFDTGHADLQGKIDFAWSFDGCSASASFSQTAPCGTASLGTKPSHGTAVAGLAAADGENGQGISGVCPKCRLMVIELPAADDATAKAIDFVATRGADVINNSWTTSYSNDYTRDALVKAAEVLPGHKGSVVVFSTDDDRDEHCAAGGLQGLYAHPDLIAVSASNNLDRRARASTVGSCVELVAPGYYATVSAPGDTTEQTGITTTDVTGTAGYNDAEPLTPITCAFTEPTGTTATNGRAYTRCFAGGSAAAPIVAGVAGLVRSLRPCLTRIQVQQILRETADKIGPTGTYGPSGHSDSYGYGRVNAHAALVAAQAMTCPSSAVVVVAPKAPMPKIEIGARLGVTHLTGPNARTVTNGPGGGPAGEPVFHLTWFPALHVMLEVQGGGTWITASGSDETNLVAALQGAFAFTSLGQSSLYLGIGMAYQHLDTGAAPATNDVAPGAVFGFRWLPLTHLAIRLEAKYRYWIDQSVHETGGAVGLGVVIP